MTRQEFYEQVRTHFSQPGVQFGYDLDAERCVYRGAQEATSPVRCGVGCMIPDASYDPEMDLDSQTPAQIYREYPGVRAYWRNSNREFLDFLDEVQNAHDSEAQTNQPSMKNFLANLDEIAKSRGLKVPISSTA